MSVIFRYREKAPLRMGHMRMIEIESISFLKIKTKTKLVGQDTKRQP